MRAYHAPPSHHYSEYRTQLLVWCLIKLGLRDHVTPALKQLHWLPVEHAQNQIQVVYSDASNSRWKDPAMLYLTHSVQSIAESSRRPGLRSANTADYIKRRIRTKFGERCFSHAGRRSSQSVSQWNA